MANNNNINNIYSHSHSLYNTGTTLIWLHACVLQYFQDVYEKNQRSSSTHAQYCSDVIDKESNKKYLLTILCGAKPLSMFIGLKGLLAKPLTLEVGDTGKRWSY